MSAGSLDGSSSSAVATSSAFGRYKIVQMVRDGDAFAEYIAELPTPSAGASNSGGSNSGGGGGAAASQLVLLRVFPLGLLKEDPKLAMQVEREVAVLRRIGAHPYIVSLIEVFMTTLELVLVFEYCEGGELFEVVETFNENAAAAQQKQHQPPPQQIAGGGFGAAAPSGIPRKVVGRLFHELVMAVSFLHSQGFCHRDIKLESCLLSGANQIKLANFSMAASLATISSSSNSSSGGGGATQTVHLSPQKYSPTLELSCGSMHYACPEVIDGLAYDGRCADVWSLGVVLFALMTGVLPFEGPTLHDEHNSSSSSPSKKQHHQQQVSREPTLFDKIRKAEYFLAAHQAFISMPKDDPARDLLQAMLVVQPARRLTLRAVLKHPFWRSCNVDVAANAALTGL